MNKPYSNTNAGGHNDNYGNWDGLGSFPDVPVVFSGFGEWPASPDTSNLIVGWRVNGLRDDNGTPGNTADDFRTDANIDFGNATIHNTLIPSATNGVSMNFYIRSGNLGAALRNQTPHGTGQLYYLNDSSDEKGSGSDANINWDWFQAGRHTGAFGDNLTVTPKPEASLSAVNGSTILVNLGISPFLNLANVSSLDSILTGVAIITDDGGGVFSFASGSGYNVLGGSSEGAEIYPINDGSNLSLYLQATGGGSGTMQLFLNDPDAGETVWTFNLVVVPEPSLVALLALGALLLRFRRRNG